MKKSIITGVIAALLAYAFIMMGGCASVSGEKQITSLFPKQEWTDYAYAKCKSAAFTKVKTTDAWYTNTPQDCVYLLASMAKYESSFNASTTYKESFKNSKGEFVISTGLFQLSYESARGYGFSGITTEQLKDPYKNFDVAIAILDKWVVQDKVIAGNGVSPYRGGARYFSTLRLSGKLGSVRATYEKSAYEKKM